MIFVSVRCNNIDGKEQLRCPKCGVMREKSAVDEEARQAQQLHDSATALRSKRRKRFSLSQHLSRFTEYKEAKDLFTKAWKIREILLHPFHLQRTATAMSMQDCCLDLEDYPTALIFAKRVCTAYDCMGVLFDRS